MKYVLRTKTSGIFADGAFVPPVVIPFLLLRLDKLSYDAHMIAEGFPQRGMFDVEAPGSVGFGGEAH